MVSDLLGEERRRGRGGSSRASDRARARRLGARHVFFALRPERERARPEHALLHQRRGDELVQLGFPLGFSARAPHQMFALRVVPQPIRPGLEPGLAFRVAREHRALDERATKFEIATFAFHREIVASVPRLASRRSELLRVPRRVLATSSLKLRHLHEMRRRRVRRRAPGLRGRRRRAAATTKGTRSRPGARPRPRSGNRSRRRGGVQQQSARSAGRFVRERGARARALVASEIVLVRVVVVVVDAAEVIIVLVEKIVAPHVPEIVRERARRRLAETPRGRGRPPASLRRVGRARVRSRTRTRTRTFRRRRGGHAESKASASRASQRERDVLETQRTTPIRRLGRRLSRLGARGVREEPRDVHGVRRRADAPRLAERTPIHHANPKRQQSPAAIARRRLRVRVRVRAAVRAVSVRDRRPRVGSYSSSVRGGGHGRSESAGVSSADGVDPPRRRVLRERKRQSHAPIRVQGVQPRGRVPGHARVRHLQVRIGRPRVLVRGRETRGVRDVDDERTRRPRRSAPRRREIHPLDVLVIPPGFHVRRREHGADARTHELVHARQIVHGEAHRSDGHGHLGFVLERDVDAGDAGDALRETKSDEEAAGDGEVGDVDGDGDGGKEIRGLDPGADEDVRGDGVPGHVELELEVILGGVVPGDVHAEVGRDDAEGELLDGGGAHDAAGHGVGVGHDALHGLLGLGVHLHADDRAPLVAKHVIDPLEHARLDGGVPRVAGARVRHRGLGGAEAAVVRALRHARGEETGGEDEDPVVHVEENRAEQIARPGEPLLQREALANCRHGLLRARPERGTRRRGRLRRRTPRRARRRHTRERQRRARQRGGAREVHRGNARWHLGVRNWRFVVSIAG